MTVAVAALVIAGLLALQTSPVQTYLSSKIIEKVSAASDADISIGKVLVKPFNTLVLKNVEVADRNPANGIAKDTLFKAEYIIARFSIKGLGKGEGLYIGRAYVRDASLNLVIEQDRTNIERIFGIEKHIGEKKKQGNVFNIRRVHIDNLGFRMQNFKKGAQDTVAAGINWTDMDVSGIKIEARNLKLSDRVMSGTLDHLSFKEKSGYECMSISGSAKVGHGICAISDLHIRDPWSEIRIPGFSMSYGCSTDFRDFMDKVCLDAVVSDSRLGLKTLGFFAPGLPEGDVSANISVAEIHGTVDDFIITDFSSSIEGIGISARGQVKGIPEMRRMDTDLHIGSIRFTSSKIEALAEKLGFKGLKTGQFAPGQEFSLSGSIKGKTGDFKVGMRLHSGMGSASSDLRITGFTGNETAIKGKISTDNIDIGGIIGKEIIRECSLEAGITASIGKKESSVGIDSLSVSRLHLNGYDYSDIAAIGTVTRNRFDGKIICSDPNLNFLFQGLFTIAPKTMNSLYRFYINVGYADLNALNIDKRGTSKIRFRTAANFNRIRKGDMLGNIDTDGIVLENDSGKYDIGKVIVSSNSSGSGNRVKFTSSFAEGTFAGTSSVSGFARDIRDIVLKKELPAMYGDSTYRWSGNSYRLNLKLFDTMDLLAFVMPGLYIAENTSLDVKIDTSGILQGMMDSQRLAFRENYIKDMRFVFGNGTGSLSGELESESISAATVMMKNNRISMLAHDNHLGFGYTYDNPGELRNRGEFYVVGDIAGKGKDDIECKISMLPSTIWLNSREWKILPSSMALKGKDIEVDNIELQSGEQSVKVYGGISRSKRDTMFLNLDRFDISIARPLIGKGADLSGAATGRAMLVSDIASRNLLMDFICDSTAISGTQIGTVSLGSTWDETSSQFRFAISNSLRGGSSFDISGTYSPWNKTMDAKAVLDRFDISAASPFLSSIFSETSGFLSGRFSASGPLSDIRMESEGAGIEDATLRIAFTNVPYTVNGGFHIDSRGIYFDDIAIADRHGNSGTVKGGIGFENFSNMTFDTYIDVTRIECIDIPEKTASAFYGNIFATAAISLKGPANALSMTVDATTTGNGQLHVPIASGSRSEASNLLTFKEIKKEEKVDPYEEMVLRLQKKEKSKGDLDIKLKVAATPGVQAFVEIDKSTGNVLTGYGSGVIDLEVRPSMDVFNISGDYALAGGNYKFVAIGLAKDFSIREGSSIRFNGDIMESTLNIDAVYRTKTSLSTLIADTTSVAGRRTVECGIRITDKISNPRLQFSIDVPDVDATVKPRVESALSTEDKVQKQFLSLLMSNSFLPDEQSGIVNNSAFLTSSVSEIMSNQLNNIFQKLDIPLDFGLNYQTNDRGNDIFDVAVSTQLFNNRVVVNGNIGNRQYSSGSSNGDVVGDLDIEVKLDRPGSLRLSLFSHSADQYTNYLDNSQRNGIGIAYQQEFNTFREFFKKLFAGKKKKEEMQRIAEKEMLSEEKITVKIGKKK